MEENEKYIGLAYNLNPNPSRVGKKSVIIPTFMTIQRRK